MFRFLMLLAFVLFSCDCAHMGQFLSRDMVKQLHKANVRLSNSTGFCSGVIVGEDTILTAAHCTKGCAEKNMAVSHYNGATTADSWKCDLENDVALVKTKDKLRGGMRVGKPAKTGDPIYVVSNPVIFGPLQDFTTIGMVATRIGNMLFLTALVRGGSSGGAVYNMDGEIVGIIVGIPTGPGGEVPGSAIATSIEPINGLMGD